MFAFVPLNYLSCSITLVISSITDRDVPTFFLAYGPDIISETLSTPKNLFAENPESTSSVYRSSAIRNNAIKKSLLFLEDYYGIFALVYETHIPAKLRGSMAPNILKQYSMIILVNYRTHMSACRIVTKP